MSITLKSTVTKRKPTATSLQVGQLAVNTADQVIYSKHNSLNGEDPNSSVIPVSISPKEKGVFNGVATLDDTGKVPSTQLPADILSKTGGTMTGALAEAHISLVQPTLATEYGVTVDLSLGNSFGFATALTKALTLNFTNVPACGVFSVTVPSGSTAYAVTLGTGGTHHAAGGLSKLTLTASSKDKLVCEVRNGTFEWSIIKDIKA